MRKILVIALAVIALTQITAGALEIKSIQPDTNIITQRGIDVEGDKEYLKSIARIYSPFFVVKQEEYVDISDIDRFYKELSTPISVEEVDKGKLNMNLGIITDNTLKNNLNQFKVIGALGGYESWFEPVSYFNIYRDITLVGGYSCYKRIYNNPDDAGWAYITGLESLTKEILSYNTRLNIYDRMHGIDDYVNNDNTFKIFLLRNGKIDSVWERDVL